jgi:hypothetical protein
MASNWRPALAVFLATAVVAVGVAIVVATSRDDGTAAAAPSSSSTGPTPRPTVATGCRIGQGPVRLARVPARVATRVDRAWDRIETWLAEHAPVTAAALAPPASDEDIAAAQRVVGVRLPAELVASLRRHDGTGTDLLAAFTFPSFMQPLSAAEIADEATMMCGVLEDLGDIGAVGPWWHGRYVPVAVDHGGDSLFLDGARLGYHYEADDVSFNGPAGLAALLEETADALSGGGEYTPVVVNGTLGWD